ncbi:DUF2474 family protein [Polymorphobacter arshaanensis]|uniref:DUF2474 family protein n=1 Tax=Glacieibacterium arshaanense TaxID=2511025 RepID=A0A4Y9ETA4_9SPHN|nr:DUF2474 family protein [Polymorphobacter arshaanensis]
MRIGCSAARCGEAVITTETGPLWRRMAWFIALWLGGVLSVGAVAWVIRAVLL